MITTLSHFSQHFYILRICTFVLDLDYPIDAKGSLERQCCLDMFYIFFLNSLQFMFFPIENLVHLTYV